MSSSGVESGIHRLDAALAQRFATIALGHVDREYPHKLDHVLDGDGDALPPRSLHPLFHGSFDWHSCVHGYWLLATLLRLYPGIAAADEIRRRFDARFTTDIVAAECAYLARPSSRGFERPYGWAWLLMLQAELRRHDTEPGRRWAAALQALADVFTQRFHNFLPKATYPVRAGVHTNTAFALALAQEYAQQSSDSRLLALLKSTAARWYSADAACQAWEPSGDDFLSPALIEAECQRRLLPRSEFRQWFARFLPRAALGEPASLFEPATVSDRSDGKIAHLDGLNLSRAWCWRSITGALAADDPLKSRASTAVRAHLDAALSEVAGDYMGEHWLASFALLALRES
ncbi:MAG: hypothetical protein JWQ90_5430 [Hydrocarboniphaga sp.]|uniref:DUF2891 domain-containing protein n=1 Tax=Hydrocarboniphaga sp. TaxID=2033016 RepID=UPI0026101E29|nr:DUF2891 domain-containing protein [Hydrocarboniphaga sp.]MDB5972980.1 hypothetical protein [Hydrocarboniphaga sp.]